MEINTILSLLTLMAASVYLVLNLLLNRRLRKKYEYIDDLEAKMVVQPAQKYNTRYEYWINRHDKFTDYNNWFWDIVNNNAVLKPQTTLIVNSGFKNIGSYFTVVLFYNFLYKKDGNHIYLTQYSRPKFNVEFLNSQIAMATLLKLKAINPLKYELNNDQQSIDFYLDSTSLNEIITCYTDK